MRLHIYREDILVGDLYTSEDGIQFQYDSGYLASTAPPVSLSLPLQISPYAQHKALPFFEGLLPESEQRRELSAILRVASASTMKLLEALGGECLGNLTVIDDETDIAHALDDSRYTLLEDAELENLLRPQSMDRVRFVANRRLSLAGAQAKFGLFFDSGDWYATEGLASTTHIIKPISSFDPTILINEYYMMKLAKCCEIEVPEVNVIRFGEFSGFTIERYDRRRLDGKIQRIGQEDFCQALSIMPQNKYENEGGPGFKELFSTTLHHTTRPAFGVTRLLRLALFNYLIGNCDAHAKNFSLLQSPETGYLTLAPAYDLISTTFYGDRLLSSMAMKIGEHTRIDRITSDDFALFSLQTGISLAAIRSEYNALCEVIVDEQDSVIDLVRDEAKEFLPDALRLREHLLQEFSSRVDL
jgi:serine/threonine-protein kinase HipA